MAKIKKELEIQVKNPEIGKKYYFKFAGSINYGVILDMCESLTRQYGHQYYTIQDSKLVKYPVSIYSIITDPKHI